MEEKMLHDITNSTGMSFFYPCSGMDIDSIINIINFREDLLIARNFFLVDLNIDDHNEVNGCNQRQLYFDNKLGLKGFEILEKEEYKLNDIEELICDFLKEYETNERYNELVSKIIEPKAFRYVLNYKSNTIILYLFHYEACIISEKLKTMKNESQFGLILQSHVNGGYEDDFFINKMKEFDADFLKIDNCDKIHFDSYEIPKFDEGFYLKDKDFLKKLKVENVLRLC